MADEPDPTEDVAALVEALGGPDAGFDASLSSSWPVSGSRPADDRTIHQRLAAILDELPAIGKSQKNEQQGFMFRGHDDVMAALNPLLGKHGVVIVPNVVKRKTAERKTRSGSTMYEVNLHVQFAFVGLRGDGVLASTWGEGTDSGDKATSKAHTMAFKSALAVVFAISTHEASQADPDGQTPEETTGRSGRRQTAPAAQRPFDPGVDVREDAPQGEGFQARIAEILNEAAPGVDWHETLKPFIRSRFDVETRVSVPDRRLAEYWRRTTNFAARLAEEGDLTKFPPLVDRDGGPFQILGVLAWAFADGEVPEGAAIVFPEPPPTEPVEDDVPFGGPDDPVEPPKVSTRASRKGAGSVEPDAAPDPKQAALDEQAREAAERDEPPGMSPDSGAP